MNLFENSISINLKIEGLTMINYCRKSYLLFSCLICSLMLSSWSFNAASEKSIPYTPRYIELARYSEMGEGQDSSAPEEPKGNKVAYITIDDGPSNENTTAILDLLMNEDIKATFFVLPHDGVEDIYKRIINEGHEIGNHSYSHDCKRLYKIDDIEYFREDIQKMQEYLLEKLGYEATSFRFPGGSMGRKKEIIEPRKAVLSEMGYHYFDWDVSTCDTDAGPEGKKVEALVNNVVDSTKDREKLIILMHDSADKQTTVEALPIIISKLREQGYTFDILKNY